MKYNFALLDSTIIESIRIGNGYGKNDKPGMPLIDFLKANYNFKGYKNNNFAFYEDAFKNGFIQVAGYDKVDNTFNISSLLIRLDENLILYLLPRDKDTYVNGSLCRAPLFYTFIINKDITISSSLPATHELL